MLIVILFFLCLWLTALTVLWFWKKPLFIATWREPYFAETPVLIESDDWGPGGDYQAERLRNLLGSLATTRDSRGRCAVLTADVVLAVPDVAKIQDDADNRYFRKRLDTDFPEIFEAMRSGVTQGTFVPQLHGLEHLNGEAFAKLLGDGDSRLNDARAHADWWDWESLDSPLQGHYVDGSQLPTTPIAENKARDIVETAGRLFIEMFGQPTLTTVAPCYLWGDAIEACWREQRITAIQTAGYRCLGRDGNGKYFADPTLIRCGERNRYDQVYLVRNVMFEPTDGKHTPDSAYAEALAAHRQALPLTISTHKYNFTRSDTQCRDSIAGLQRLLSRICTTLPHVRFLASPELAEWLNGNRNEITNRFNGETWQGLSQASQYRKVGAFLYRLYYRHPKLAWIAYLSGLIFPAWFVCATSTRDS
ncbi:hypothetical protein [Methylomonas sp. UP202]|uniref:hypothetical protein n=1 Tax=Methylomonas sp. UP202 TaxID=3040943 RepID=UPI00143A6585|nr:hypothetical protein [Methylomonas sp. UP202]NJA06769.1 hypothetical protein [Methylococcaceae bacterium WWC4]WGS87913.1 hypothetical protein QC632_09165 [Methylomonas sp. UP202]